MKKIIAAFLMLMTVVLITPAALAAPMAPAVPKTEFQSHDDVRARRQQIIEDMSEKFSALSNAEKAKFYKLDAKMTDLVCQMADLYAEYDLIDEDVAEKIGQMAKQRAKTVRQEGRLPGVIGPY